jgi:hypothetical protein
MSVAGFDLPHLPEDDRLRAILRGALKARKCAPVEPPPEDRRYWSPEFLGLDKVPLFGELGEDARRQVLRRCAQDLLTEAYFVEKAGVGYAARMTLEAESTEERALYGMVAAEEATHLCQVAGYLPDPDPVGTEDPFLRFMGDLIEDAPKSVCLFVVQVVLEGWGLTHYRNLATGCSHPGLKAILESILLDEARHHGSGVVLLESRELSARERDLATESLEGFLGMVRVGPQRVVAALEEAAGHFTHAQRVQVLRDLDAEAHSGERLAVLRTLMKTPNVAGIIEDLESRGSFQPLPPERCAA